ncbi:pyridoxamine 5'-phosphate oxidase family protein [Halorarius halobius]|uniref:pyridoxamine 5'-phosphate oxidase family protein n=1 Tax=Halorarius halobius TaxID=2962671 RepID=UPI0020CF7B6D|nr:pyridoxamine 5'-phosphate oxidase family protein [Halorarius halobius]
MDIENVQYADTRGLSDREVGDLLAAHHVGVLALADDGSAYAVPVDYHYDGESLILRLSDDGESRKLAYVEATTDPQFLVYGHGGDYESWSVLVRGEIEELDPDAEGIDAATVNDWFGPVRVFDETVPDLELRLFRLVPESMVGRATLD